MFESDLEDNIFRRRLMKEVVPGVPVHFSFYSPGVKVQIQAFAEHLPGANGRYVGDAVSVEFVPEDAAAVERVREFVWRWEVHNEFTAVRKINYLRRAVDPESVQGILELVRGVDKRAAAKAAEAVYPDELEEMIEAEDAKALARLPGLGEKRAHAVVEFYRNEKSEHRFLYAANRNDRFRGPPVFTELDLEGDLEEQVADHAARAQFLGDPDPLSPNEPPGHTTVRNPNLLHPLPMTPSLMGRGVYYPEQVALFTDTLRRVLVNGERLAGVEDLRVQRGKLFHTTKLPGVGLKTRARITRRGRPRVPLPTAPQRWSPRSRRRASGGRPALSLGGGRPSHDRRGFSASRRGIPRCLRRRDHGVFGEEGCHHRDRSAEGSARAGSGRVRYARQPRAQDRAVRRQAYRDHRPYGRRCARSRGSHAALRRVRRRVRPRWA